MTMYNRQSPVWYEGMTLDPHHFQQWERHLQFELTARSRAGQPLSWGFSTLDIDRETLANGQFSLRACKGITQDGFLFDCPGSHRLPQAQTVKEHFAAADDRAKVYLALPVEQARGRNCQLIGTPENRQTRFTVENIPATDDNTGSAEREIGICQPNLRIIFGDDKLDDFSALQVAEIIRGQDGTYSLSDKFIPPCLSIAASANLLKVARNILELLVGKSDSLSERRKQQSSGQVDFTGSDISLLGILQVINGAIPFLHYQITLGTCHPETLFTSLASLAGSLMTFSADVDMRPSDIPLYEHGNSGERFAVLNAKIMQLLGTTLSANFIRIPLDRRSESQWIGQISDHGLFTSAHFYLAASGEVPERKLIDELPLKMKVGGADEIAMLVNAALPGLIINYTARPPAGLPSRPGLQYFRLEKSGRLWDAIVREGNMALFVPSDFKSVKFELMAITSS